jgi:hypothetical protein
MIITAAELRELAAQVRSLDSSLERQIDQVRGSHLWRGSDAARYLDRWDSDVHARLLAAAGDLENLSLMSLP